MPMDDTPRSGKGRKPPVSAHPAFPAVVALWFAAFLGLGSLVLPVRLYETAIAATGIAELVSAAAPPLGFTARALIALVATVLGAALGFYAARRIVGGRRGARALESGDAGYSSRGPMDDFDFDELDELDDDDDLPPLRETAPPAGRRRALALQEEEGVSELLNAAPLPSADGEHYADFSYLSQDEEDDALELSEEIAPEEDEAPSQEAAEMPRQEFIPGGETEELQDESPLQMRAVDMASQAEDAPAMPEPLPFSPPSLARSSAENDKAPQPGFLSGTKARLFDTPAPEADASPPHSPDAPDDTGIVESSFNPSEDPVTDMPSPPSDFSAPDMSDDSRVADFHEEAQPEARHEAPDESQGEGLVQLVQKLGSTLEKHREWSARRAEQPARPTEAEQPQAAPDNTPLPPQPEETRLAQDFDPAAADEAAQAMAAYFGKPAAEPKPEAGDAQENPGETTHDQPAPRAFDAPRRVFEPVEAGDPMHPSAPAPVAGEAYAPLKVFGSIADEADDADEDDLAASLTLPIKPTPSPAHAPVASASPEPAQGQAQAPAQGERPAFDIPPPSPGAAAEAGEEATESPAPLRDADYGSLAANNPFKRQAEDFVRVDAPEPSTAQPAVVFPNQQAARSAAGGEASPAGASAASNDDNERALREALMNLQRMGK